MKICILSDNRGKAPFIIEHGLSIYIHSDASVLLDTGQSNIFIHNAEKMGVDIDAVKTVILSHGHYDHGNGLKYLSDKTLIAHPGVFKGHYRSNGDYIGVELSEQEMKQRLNVQLSSEPVRISENIIFIGAVHRNNSFESLDTPFIDYKGRPDFILDDSGIAVVENGRLTVITGCAHAGICNTVQAAKAITGIEKAYWVIGGFHMHHIDKRTEQTAEYLKANVIKGVIPLHCTGDNVIDYLRHEVNVIDAGAGSVLHL